MDKLGFRTNIQTAKINWQKLEKFIRRVEEEPFAPMYRLLQEFIPACYADGDIQPKHPEMDQPITQSFTDTVGAQEALTALVNGEKADW